MEVTQEEKIDFNSLVADAAIELNMSKSEVKTLVQKEKVKSELKDGHYYVNVGEIQTYLSKLEMEQGVTTSVVSKTEEEKVELLTRFDLDIKKIDGKLKRISSGKPVNNPFNYSGGKEELYPQILPYIKSNIATFYDIFGGGGIMNLNVEAKGSVYSEGLAELCNLIDNLRNNSIEENYQEVLSILDEYKLSKDDEQGYYKLRKEYNASEDRPWSMFYLLIIYSYRNMISFNEAGEFNKAHGKRYLNNSLKAKFLLYTDKLIANRHRMTIENQSYSFIDTHKFKENDFVYVDPPYLISDSKYGVRWEDEEEIALLESLDSLNERKVDFALSNFIHDNGKTNQILIDWAEQNSDYNIIYLNKSYEDQKRNKVEGAITVEVLITNYKTLNSKEAHEITMMDTEIVQGRFVVEDSSEVDNEVANINKYFNRAEEANQNFLLSMKQALEQKCIELINRVKAGQELIIFHEKCIAEGKVYKDEFEKQSFGFHLETARGYMKLARDERIVKLTVEDMIRFKRKSLDALHDMTFLTDDEFNLFLEGKHVLKSTRPIAKSRKKSQEPSNTQNNEVPTESDLSSPDTLKQVNSVVNDSEFVNNTSLSDAHYKEIMKHDEAELRKQHILLASAEYLILGNSSKSGFPGTVHNSVSIG